MLHLGKETGYTVIITARAFCDACAVRGTRPQEGATHFLDINVYIHARSVSQLQLYSLVWGSLRSPNDVHILIKSRNKNILITPAKQNLLNFVLIIKHYHVFVKLQFAGYWKHSFFKAFHDVSGFIAAHMRCTDHIKHSLM